LKHPSLSYGHRKHRESTENSQKSIEINFGIFEGSAIEMAEDKYMEIREDAFSKCDLTCLHFYHSLKNVDPGEICLISLLPNPGSKQ